MRSPSKPLDARRFERRYARVDPQLRQALWTFRQENPPRTIVVDGVAWPHLVVGQGTETILFLHGMAGSYDLWWRQIAALSDRFRIVTLTYPAVDTLEAMRRGINALLEAYGVERFNMVGTSLGGYIAQYLLAHQPERVLRAVLGNTLPPNDLLARRTRRAASLLKIIPNALLRFGMDINTRLTIYPASGRSELLKAYLLEGAWSMTRELFQARYRCVIEKFEPPDLAALGIPTLIIEARNDPLISPELRRLLRETYPSARVHTLGDVGHFSYLHDPDTYNRLLKDFFTSERPA